MMLFDRVDYEKKDSSVLIDSTQERFPSICCWLFYVAVCLLMSKSFL